MMSDHVGGRLYVDNSFRSGNSVVILCIYLLKREASQQPQRFCSESNMEIKNLYNENYKTSKNEIIKDTRDVLMNR